MQFVSLSAVLVSRLGLDEHIFGQVCVCVCVVFVCVCMQECVHVRMYVCTYVQTIVSTYEGTQVFVVSLPSRMCS